MKKLWCRMFHRKDWREIGIRPANSYGFAGHQHVYRCAKCQQKQREYFGHEVDTDEMP